MTASAHRTVREASLSALLRGLWLLSAAYARMQPQSRRLPGDARRILEREIFPAVYVDPDVRTVLFAGVGPYTSWYPGLFRLRPRLSFDTIDSDPETARWGARRRHRAARLESLRAATECHGVYDLVIANGLFGFGTESHEAAQVIDACHAILKPGGRLLLGYSAPGTFDPATVDSARFRATPIPGLGVDRHVTANENGHAFACFKKV